MRLINVDCDKEECPQFETCPQIKTDYRTARNEVRVDILFIGDAGSPSDGEKRMPFTGQDGRLLRTIIDHYDTDDFFGDTTTAYSQVVRAVPPKVGKKRRPTQREIDMCQPYLMRDIVHLRPRKIVALGKLAYTALTGRDEKSQTIRGKWQDFEYDGQTIPLMYTYHPRRILQEEHLVTLFMDDLEKAFGQRDNLLIDNTGETIIVTTVDEVTAMVNELLATTDMVAVDIETKNLSMSRKHNKLITIQFCADGHRAFVLPMRHHSAKWTQEEYGQVVAQLRRLFSSPKAQYTALAGWGFKFDLAIVRRHLNIWMNQHKPVVDGLAAWFLIDENRLGVRSELDGTGTYTLKQAGKYFGFDGYDAEILRARSEGELWNLPIQELADYGAMDVRVTWQAIKNFYKLADIREPGYSEKMDTHLRHYFSDAYRFLAMAELNGMMIDRNQINFLTGKTSPLLLRQEVIEQEFQINPNANKALVELSKRKATAKDSSGAETSLTMLFGAEATSNQLFQIHKGEARLLMFFDEKILGLEPLKTGKKGTTLFPKGQPSIDKNFIEFYQDKVPEVGMLAEHRKMGFMINTFLKKIRDMVTPGTQYFDPNNSGSYRPEGEDGRVRPSIGLTFTQTGRSNQWNPSLQQIPSAEEDDGQGKFLVQKSVKDVFIAGVGNVIIQIDYRVSEVRWLGLISWCKGLIATFLKAKKYMDAYRKSPSEQTMIQADMYGDIHKLNASLAYNRPIHPMKQGKPCKCGKCVTKAERQGVKGALVFGGIYGAGLKSIAARIGKSLEYTKKLMDTFWQRMPGAKTKLDAYVKEAETEFMVESPFFQRRRLYSMMVGQINVERDNRGRLKGPGTKVIAHCRNQAKNSPIQNASSVNSLIASSIFADWIIKQDLEDKWLLTNCVHDSVVGECPFRWKSINKFLEVAEDCFTNRVSKYITKHYGFEMCLPLEVDFEIGFSWGSLYKWDYTEIGLRKIYKMLKADYDALPDDRKREIDREAA